VSARIRDEQIIKDLFRRSVDIKAVIKSTIRDTLRKELRAISP
jgi:hypothetical protein